MIIDVSIDSLRRAHTSAGKLITHNTDMQLRLTVEEGSGFDPSQPISAIIATDCGRYPAVTSSTLLFAVPTLTVLDGRFAFIGFQQGSVITTTDAKIIIQRSIIDIKSTAADPQDAVFTPVFDEVDDDDLIQIQRAEDGKRGAVPVSLLPGGGSSIEPYTSTPQMDGVGSAGSSDLFARGDHQHPTDTTRAEAPNTLVFEYDNGFWEPQFSYAELMTAYEAWVNSGKRMVARLLGAHFSAGQYEEDGAIDLTHFDLAETHYVFSDVFSIASTDPEERGECQRWAFELHFDAEQTGVDEGVVNGGELFTFQVADADAVAAVAEIANAKYTKPASGIPASDLASGVIPTVPSAATAAPSDLAAVAAVGTSTKYARQDHKHKMPSASDVGALASNTTYVSSVNGQSGDVTVTVPSAATATPSDLGTAAVGSSAKYAREDHVHNKPTYTASDVGALPSNTTYVSSVNGNSGAVTLTIPSTAADVGAATPPKYTTLTLAVADWESSGSAYACSKTVTGMTATSIVWLEYSDTETEFTEAQSANTLTFTVASLPSAAITVNVAFMEGSALS